MIFEDVLGEYRLVTKNIFTLEKATGPFLDLMKPYKKWFEKVYIGSLYEINGQLYRNVCTKSLFNKKFIRKVLLCTDRGEVVKDESIRDKGIEILTYLTYLTSVEHNIRFDAQRTSHEKYNKAIKYLKSIQELLQSHLSDEEQLFIDKQLKYYKTIQQLLDELVDISNNCLIIVERLNELEASDTIFEEEFNEMHSLILQREKKRNFIEAIMLENNYHVWPKVEDILYDKNYKDKLKNYQSEKRYIENEADEINHSSHSIIKNGQINFKIIKETLNIDYGKFTVDKYIELLFDPKFANMYFNLTREKIKHEHSVFSPKLRY